MQVSRVDDPEEGTTVYKTIFVPRVAAKEVWIVFSSSSLLSLQVLEGP